MPDIPQSNTNISSRRRKQNVRAQQRYRERQKRRLQDLEALVAVQIPRAEDGLLLPDNQEERDLTDRLINRKPECSTINSAASPSGVLGSKPKLTEDDPIQVLAFIDNHLGGVDTSTSGRIGSGEITIRDILKAGLSSLNLPSGNPTQELRAEYNATSCPALRTDKILVLEKRKLFDSHSFPSINTNYIRLKQFSTISALRANAERFGLTFEELTDPATGSLFYDQAIGKDGAKSISPELLESMPHLKPIYVQFKHPHHVYIDLIPCPKFRQQFIQLTTTNPPRINKGEFCADLENDGLICWASYTGSDNEVSGSSAPWDIRSWEAQPWFLKKWWLVFGDESGIFQQTKWWHEFRGDHLPYFGDVNHVIGSIEVCHDQRSQDHCGK